MVIRALALLAAAASCTPLTSDFVCAVDQDCASAAGEAGRCEPTGRCSLPDPTCSGGFRYTDFAGDLSGRCTALDDCVAEVRAGDASTCVRRGDGEVWCWGDGAAQPAHRELPSGDIVAIDLGGTTRCARYATGAVMCWAGSVPGAFPAPPGDGPAIGRDHACVLGDGRVACWGANARGQLGDATTTARTTPAFVTGITTATAVAAGDDTACAMTSTGTVWCWGDDNRGQLGRGLTPSEESAVPVQAIGISTAVSIAVGKLFSCATVTSGDVFCWGLNDHAQLGFDGILDEETAPQHVPNLTGVERVSAGGGHVCALGRDGTLRCWGANDAGQCGTAPGGDVVRPTVVVDDGGAPLRFTAVETGARHTCARAAADGALYCWGANAGGQLGTGSFDGTARPTRVALSCE